MNKWKITIKADSIYIENISNKKVLEIAFTVVEGEIEFTVVEEEIKDGKIEQHWDKQGSIYSSSTVVFLTVKLMVLSLDWGKKNFNLLDFEIYLRGHTLITLAHFCQFLTN